jgi:hypothetical protein
MGRFICHLDGKFFEWSTVVDAPVAYLMEEAEFVAYQQADHDKHYVENELPARMARARSKGTSSMLDDSLEALVRGNRAGPGEKTLSFKKLCKYLVDETERARHDGG